MSTDVPMRPNSPLPVTIMSPPASSSSNSSVTSLLQPVDAPPPSEIDPQILEALASKDRIYVLKLGELMEGLINDRTHSRQRVDLSPATSYQRMLVHRCSAYYGLVPETDPATKAISVLATQESRIPPRRLAELAPAPAEAPPKFKIMMRTPRSQTGSVTGDDGEVSDVDASETGSMGGRSSAGASKKPRTIEERTAAYNEARSRIFIDFEEKDQKDTASSASSSASMVSDSSTNPSDDPGSPATESEWSAPSVIKKQPPNRANSSSSSSRSLRSSAPAFMSSSGSSSSRNSRAPSPAFKYPTLYEPPPNGPISVSVPSYDQPHAHTHPAPTFQPSAPIQYYPYSAQPHAQQQQQQQQQQQPQQPYMAPYPYYQPYPYSHPPTPGSDPEVYAYPNPYAWAPYSPQNGQGQPQPPNQSQNQHQHHHHNGPPNGSPPPMQQYPGFSMSPPAHAASAPTSYTLYDGTPTAASPPAHYAPGYYPPPPHHGHLSMPPYMGPPHPAPGQYDGPRTNGSGSGAGNGRGNVNGHANANGRNPRGANGVNGHNNNNNGGKAQVRSGTLPPPPRSAWSYGPGVGGPPVDFPSSGGGAASGYPPLMRDAVGPRLSGGIGVGMSVRRGSSGNRTTSGSSSNCDDVSSVASSSTTSSSSRRTYTSTTSSQQHHPLPARPDWAVGLRPNPTLHAPRHDSLTSSRNMSPVPQPRSLNGHSSTNPSSGTSSPHALSASSLRQQQLQQDSMQPSQLHVHLQQQQQQHHASAQPSPPPLTEFPPLTSASPAAPAPEKQRTPVVVGAWTNSSSTRSIVMAPTPPAAHPHPQASGGGSALVQHHGEQQQQQFHPKTVRRPTTGGAAGGKEKDRARGDAVANAILVAQVAGMTLEERGAVSSGADSAVGAGPTKEPSAVSI